MSDILKKLDLVLKNRKQESKEKSYVSSLYNKGLDTILKKIAEESAETIMAAKDAQANSTQKNKEHLIYEVSDLWFHTMILLAHQNLSSQDVINELQRRFGISGIEEKYNRQKPKL